MASSSTSSIPNSSFKYDVFLSFRGEDTRTNFVDHLFHALKLENIETYKDDENLEKGKRIGKELIQAIQDSRFHVIVFSKNYASSSWCLDELVKIMECQKMQTGNTVYPIFYDVEPTHVRNQSGEFGKAFSKHENDESFEKWRKALVEATSFSGRDLRTTANGHEVEFIKIVIKEISLKLPSISLDENLIGMRTRIGRVLSSINASPDEFCMIGITGIGGSGKTTLARAIFDQISNQFQGNSFVENVRESSNSLVLGLKSLQQQILRDVLSKQNIIVNGVFEGKKMLKRNMHSRKVLIVLDDVDHIDQLKALAGEPNWFMKGSKIIITTRDRKVLEAHRVNSIHDASLLSYDEAICLLSRHAFGTEIPIPEYKNLASQVVRYADGLPLTITVLGSSLCNEDKQVWIDTLKRLKRIPLYETLRKLELSYMGLDTDCKEIFLDVACMLKGWKEGQAIRVLESRGFHARRGLSVLKGKSLVTISREGRLGMHDHIQEMGRYIVRQSNLEEPGRHTRLWIEEEITDILTKNLGSEATKCVHLRLYSDINLEAIMKGLRNMENLRFLLVHVEKFNIHWVLDEVSQYFPNSLQYLNWEGYPFRSLPKTFQANNLVGLRMPYSRMEQLRGRGERKVLDKLRFLELNNSSLRTLDLGITPNLEVLDLSHCSCMVKLHMPFGCPKLKSLNLSSSTLRSLHLRRTPNLDTLNLEGCNDLVEFHIFDQCPQLKSLDLTLSNLRTLDLRMIPNLETLKLQRCDNLVELSMHDICREMKTLSLRYCPRLMTIDLGLTPNLEEFTLDGHDEMVHLIVSFRCPKLKSLKLINSKLRTLELTWNLKKVILEKCDLAELHFPNRDVKLESLEIRKCSKLKTLDLVRTPNLESLRLEACSNLVNFHAPVGGLNKLNHLFISHGSSKFIYFDVSGRAGLLPELNLSAEPVDICQLHPSSNSPKFQFHCSYKEDLPSSIGNIEKLISLGLSCACMDLKSFFGSVCGLQNLRELKLKGSIPEAPMDLDRLQCLEVLTLTSTEIKHLPDSICMLKHLKSLGLYDCQLLEKLPEDLSRLECLEVLFLSGCIVITEIPNDICRMKRLKYLGLPGCNRVEELPELLGCLECLEVLNIEGTRINHLPWSILSMKKGLRVVGFRWCLELCGFTSSKIQSSEDETFCYI